MATIRCQGHYFENIQAVLFDKDGTLANVEQYLTTLAKQRSHFITTQVPAIERDLMGAFGLQGNALDPAGLMAVGSRYENEIAAAAYVAAHGYGWIEALNLVQAAFVQAEASLPAKVTQTPPLEGARPMIQQLASTGLKIGIVSADSQAEVAAFIEGYAMAPISWYCGAAATNLATTPLAKGHPDFLKFACQAMNTDCKATLIVGDSAADLQLAQQGAAGFLGMTGGWQRSPKIEMTVGSNVNLPMVTFNRLSQLEAFN
jgi:phosphoglycolate phosphatase